MWRHCVLCGAQGVWYEVGFHDFTQNPLCTCTRNVWTFAADGAFTNEFSSLCPSGKPLPTMSALNGAARLTWWWPVAHWCVRGASVPSSLRQFHGDRERVVTRADGSAGCEHRHYHPGTGPSHTHNYSATVLAVTLTGVLVIHGPACAGCAAMCAPGHAQVVWVNATATGTPYTGAVVFQCHADIGFVVYSAISLLSRTPDLAPSEYTALEQAAVASGLSAYGATQFSQVNQAEC